MKESDSGGQNMDLNKLKLDQFNGYKIVNFPGDIDTGLESAKSNIQVVLYYIDKPEDVKEFVSLCNSLSLPRENRTIMVYKKGRKDVNRDSIIGPFKEKKYPGFKQKAPMLCSLSKDLSAFVFSKEV